MKIIRMKTNHLTNPLGYRMENPTFSWVAESDGIYQKWARVEIAADADFQQILHDSGEDADISGTGYTPEFTLSPAIRYFWRVTVMADNGDCATSEPAWFETAIDSADWKAVWIEPDLDKEISPIFQKTFSAADVSNARLSICGLGIYEAYLNGQKVGNEYLLPGFHAYDFWQQFQTFDLSGLLKEGENVLSVLVGNGWYKGRFGFTNDGGERYGNRFHLIAQIDAGGKTVLSTDDSWKCTAGPIGENNIYDGEFYDAAKEISGWNQVSGEAGWQGVRLSDMDRSTLSPRLSPPITEQERFSVAEVIHTPAGETVFDFGQEVTGWVEFTCRAPKNELVTIRHGEILQGGNFYTDNLRTAKATFTYRSAGKNEKVRPHVTFFGFRYIRIDGIENPDPADFTAVVIHSNIERIGDIRTSNPKINRLFLNALWGQKGNFLDVPTDCPQRDERMGWTGDAQAFCSTASFNMDTAAFYAKYMHDMELEQLAQDGAVPHVVPVIKKTISTPFLGSDSCAWADAAAIIPWTNYLHTGDKALLAQEYPSMKLWADHLCKIDAENGEKRLWLTGFHFADWLSLDNYKEPKSSFGGTDCYYIASAFYAYSTSLTAKAAAVLGKKEDAEFFAKRSEEVKEAFRKEFFSPNGRCTSNTQTAYVVALYMDLLPEEMRPRLIAELRRLLKENNMHLTTGFVGTSYLCKVLSRYGADEDAYTLLLQEDYPSWIYEVNMGATTIWERWNSVLPDGSISDTGMNSLNHYTYGSIAEWMYRYMGGLNPIEEAPGFAKIALTPRPGGNFDWAEVSVNTASGRYMTRWEKKDGTIVFRFEVPFNCEAELTFPENAVVDGISLAAGEARILKAGCHTAEFVR
ncbi:MAG: family 78 glycoside hydrolase catalytic domain [Candidatus Merdivicinus sp.]|jgi:alpha-L-rhamnosidase